MECIICKENVNETDDAFVLTQKGADGINNASFERNNKLNAVIGNYVHKQCRQVYCNKKRIILDKKNNISIIQSPMKRSKKVKKLIKKI